MKVLVTGAAGYLGSVLVPLVLERGIAARALDAFYFGIDPFQSYRDNPSLEVINGDTRFFDQSVLRGIDAVIDLAALAQTDPENVLPPALFYEMNVRGTLNVAARSKAAGVKRYVYASTTSIYGIREEVATEVSPVAPSEIYARTKHTAEQHVLSLADDKFCPTALRFATLYGWAPRMRFDLLLNRMALSAHQGKILIGGDGEQSRVILHVRDAARAIIGVLEEPDERIRGEVFNIGSDRQNFKIIELARVIKSVFPEREFAFYGDPDNRSFRVSFVKAVERLNFRTEYTPNIAAADLRERFERGLKPNETDFVIPWWLKLSRAGQIR